MPELPEVETVRRGLAPRLEGHRLDQVQILDARLTMPWNPDDVAATLRGRRVEHVQRRGKYLIWQLDGDLCAIHHLRMTGSYSITAPGDDHGRHVRAWYRRGDVVVNYHDPRRFGTLALLDRAAGKAYLDLRLGPEPLSPEFAVADLARGFASRTAAVKGVLLDQRVVAGLGNIYVDEALHQARIAPRTPACSLSRKRLIRLHEAIVDRLQVAVEAGGSTLRDYRNVEGQAGSMQERFLVYGHGGEPCSTCGATLKTGTIAGRTTVWCSNCQR